MIYSPKQLKIFRNVKKREWLKQNNQWIYFSFTYMAAS